MNWIINPLKKYAVFSGRARRVEFWMFLAFVTLVTVFGHYFDTHSTTVATVAVGMGIVELVITIILLLPTVSLGVRRLHDTNRSGIWMLLVYLPWAATIAAPADQSLKLVTAGALLLGGGTWLILMALPGSQGNNAYGANPKR